MASPSGASPHPYRARINQPSTQQPHHNLHGRMCIAVDESCGRMATVYFVDGAVHSMRMPRFALSKIHLSSAETDQ